MAEKRKPDMVFNIKGPLVTRIADKNRETGAWSSGKQKDTSTLCLELYRSTQWEDPGYRRRNRKGTHTLYRLRMNGRWVTPPLLKGQKRDPRSRYYYTIYQIRDVMWKNVVKRLNG